ncbi:MAG: hypothetical protein ISS82_05420 [Nanoarchaeota archaeon]|nr:hypothetical protein [Nanoarchaeota archaeon]
MLKTIIIILIIVIIIGAFIIKVDNSLELDDKQDRITLAKLTGLYALKISKNMYDTTTYAIKKDWLPD